MKSLILFVLLLAAPVAAKERLELHVPDKGASPPPPMTAWWDVNAVRTDEEAQEVVIELTGASGLRRACMFHGVDAERLIRELGLPGSTSRDRRAFEAAMRPGPGGKSCVGKGIINGTP